MFFVILCTFIGLQTGYYVMFISSALKGVFMLRMSACNSHVLQYVATVSYIVFTMCWPLVYGGFAYIRIFKVICAPFSINGTSVVFWHCIRNDVIKLLLLCNNDAFLISITYCCAISFFFACENKLKNYGHTFCHLQYLLKDRIFSPLTTAYQIPKIRRGRGVSVALGVVHYGANLQA